MLFTKTGDRESTPAKDQYLGCANACESTGEREARRRSRGGHFRTGGNGRSDESGRAQLTSRRLAAAQPTRPPWGSGEHRGPQRAETHQNTRAPGTREKCTAAVKTTSAFLQGTIPTHDPPSSLPRPAARHVQEDLPAAPLATGKTPRMTQIRIDWRTETSLNSLAVYFHTSENQLQLHTAV